MEVEIKNDVDDGNGLQRAVVRIIKHQMIELDINQVDVARECEMSTTFISELFRCKKKMNLKHLSLLCRVFNLHIKLNVNPKEGANGQTTDISRPSHQES